MSLILSGTNGLSDVDGSAATPAIRGTDANTGIFFPAADTIAFSEGGVEAMRIDSAGNVGIGTASPNASADLTVKQGSSSYQLQLEQSNVTDGYGLRCDAGNGDLTFSRYASGAYGERMRIATDGNVILNLTSVTNTNGYGGLNLYAPSNAQFQIYMLKQAQIECHIGFKSGSDNNFYVGTGGGGNGVGTYGLYQQNLTNSWSAVSDLRFKTELEPITNALEKVSNVRTVTGRFIHDEENGATRRLPFLIAQDFVDALPEAVDQKDPDKLGLSYSDTVVLAFAAIKELKALTDTQAATIEALTARIEALENK